MERAIIELVERYGVLKPVQESINRAAEVLIAAFATGHKLLLAGNGGSESDCDHIAGEFLKGFCSKRPLSEARKRRLEELFGSEGRAMAEKLQSGLPAINLAAANAFVTAWANDVDAELVYAQHLLALARPGDVLWGISTGGGAKNILAALKMARELGVRTLLLTGGRHGICEEFAEVTIAVPESETFKVQELHLPVYHALCLAVEEHFFS